MRRRQNPTAIMSSKRAKTKTTKKRPQRATSNVFAMFDQSQIQEFKEAFNMIDQNRDGFIDKEDLHDMLASLGKNPTDEYLDAMMNEAPGPINFTMFLTMFGEKLNGTDPEDVIRNAFACFDEEATGFIQEDYLRELLTTMGDRFTDEEVDELYREAPIDKKGNFNYIEFTPYVPSLYIRPLCPSSPPTGRAVVRSGTVLSGSVGAVRSAPSFCQFRLDLSLYGSRQNPIINMSSKRAKTKTAKKRPQRATSNVFAMFDQSQIQEFKEAFNMIDQNRDGFIDKEDLHDMLASLGKDPTDAYLDAMMNEAPGPINFTMFLTMFGEKLNGTDPEDVIRNAFACFDEEATGVIQEDYLRELLTTMGDRFTDEEVDELYREAPIDKKGNFNYMEFTRILKHGAKDKDD
ncbi:unnamed protein product [Caretta caretta]